MSFPILDFHVHSTLKPYGHSFYPNEDAKNASSEACIWYNDPPSFGDKIIENTVGFPQFRQSDFTSLAKGGANVAVVSLYPIEASFVKPSVAPIFSNFLVDLISLLGRYRIENIKKPDFNYVKDLQQEYEFLKSLNNTIPANGTRKYKLISNGGELSAAIPSESLLIITSIEGAHVLCDGNDVERTENWANLSANVERVKRWGYPPFFITLNHHFYNGLSSHAMSLYDPVAKLIDQRYKMDQPVAPNSKYITALGYQMIDLLYTTTNGRRILIDIKHMAKETRKTDYVWVEYFWKNILFIAEQCYFYNNTKNPWRMICLGSGLDGVINPLNKFYYEKECYKLL